jgi:hypothetical protein
MDAYCTHVVFNVVVKRGYMDNTSRYRLVCQHSHIDCTFF